MTHSRAPGARRGYTIVELLMALTVLAIGVSGIIAMQKVTISANQHAKNLAIATRIAQAWQDQLAVDATQWNFPSRTQPVGNIGATRWLNNVAGNERVWFRPSYVGALDFGPGFDALGNVVPDERLQQAHFCTHIRLTRLFPENTGNGLLRAEVRVFWLREGQGGGVDLRPICSTGTDPAAVGAAIDRYHFVYQTSAIKQHTARE
jgi:prepilin-type N-terminal cleavage/methylation domain-containing protein